MAKIVVILNHWGGVPRALHRNLVAAQTWSAESYDDVGLTTTDGAKEYLCATRDVWQLLKGKGFQTAAFGATGYADGTAPVRHTGDSLPDPRLKHAETHHVDLTSLYDGAQFQGPSLVHDLNVLREATDFIEGHVGGPLAICVNLLSCRDVTLTRFGTASGPCTVECCTALTTSSFDPRTIPESVGRAVPYISNRFCVRNAVQFGETARPLSTGEYATLLHRSHEAIECLRGHTSKLSEIVLRRGGHLAVTATRSLCIGEYGGCRDGDMPLHCCARSFWCSTCPPLDNPVSIQLVDLLRRFISETCSTKTTVSFAPRPTLCTTRDDEGMFFRVRCVLYDHHYMCIGRGDEMWYVYDLHDDPHELTDIGPRLSHIASTLSSTYHATVRSFTGSLDGGNHAAAVTSVPPTRARPRPPPLTVPSVPTPPSSKREDAVFIAEQSSVAVPPRPPPQKVRKQIPVVRMKETRLNTMHR